MLSVGIDTSPAKQNLADLKSWLANDLEKGLEIKGTFNGQTVARALRDSLRNVKFGINATITKEQKSELKYEQQSLLMQFLIELDGLYARNGVFVIGATNRPNVLDQALTTRDL